MLASGKLVGFLLTKDYDQARAFFEGKLGFQFVSVDQYALVMRAGGTSIRITKNRILLQSRGLSSAGKFKILRPS